MSRKRGRPTSCTPQVISAVADSLALPMDFKHACEGEGINESTGYDWLKRGEAGEEPFDVFYQAVTRARAAGVRKMIEHSLAGGRGSQSALWHLERQFRNQYGAIQRIEHAGHDGKAIEITARAVKDMSDEELLRLVDSGRSVSGASESRALPP